VVSVKSDVGVSAAYQNAPPKPALPDPSQLPSSFAALVDASQSADPSSQLPPAPEPSAPPPPRSASDTSGTDKAPPPRDNPANDQSPPSRADTRDNDSAPRMSGKSDSDAPARTKDIKSGASKADDSKSSDKAADDATKAAGKAADAIDAGAAAQTGDGDKATIMPDPIAALLPLAAALTSAPATSANSNAPLAIAAAAIAATTATTNALTGSPMPMKGGADQTAATKTAGADANAKAPVPTVAIDATATQQTAAIDPAVAADVVLVTGLGTQGTTGKANGAKAATGIQGKTNSTAALGSAQGTKEASATTTTIANQTKAAPQPVTDAKPDSQAALASAVKADGNGASAPSQPPHDHTQVPANSQPAPAIADPNASLLALPQQLSTAAPTAASDKFSVTQAFGAAVPVSGLAVEIAATVQSGKTHFEVRLDPADLGRIDVRIDVDRNGQVTSHLTVEKPETLSMLKQDAPQLQQALNDAGLKSGSGGLQFSLRDQSQSGQNNPNNNQTGGQPQRLVVNEEDSVPAAIAGRSYGRMMGASGGVDIRV
jgi:flagellar hook-length control protein FliK